MKKQLSLAFLAVLCPVIIFGQWIQQATNFKIPLRGLWDISIVDENTVWAIAYDGTMGINSKVPEFTKTVDGGETWVPGSFPAGYSWSNIHAIDAMTAWVSVVIPAQNYEGALFKTIDGGASWNEVGESEIFQDFSYANGVFFWNANEGVALGDPNPVDFEIYTTSNGGDDWVRVPGENIADPEQGEFGLYKSHVAYGDHIWFSTSRNRVYHSSDKGHTWTVGGTGISTANPLNLDLAFWNENEGIARVFNSGNSTNRGVARTSDGGTTWESITVSGTFFGGAYSGIAYVPGTTSTLVSAGVGGVSGSSYSIDGGSNWITIDTMEQHYITKFLNPETGWSASFNSDETTGIWKYTGDLVGVKNTLTGKEISFKAYPNPSDGHINIQMNNGEADDLKLSVYNIEGRLVHQQHFGDPGEFFMRGIDLTKLVKGVYTLKIENGILHHSEKLIMSN